MGSAHTLPSAHAQTVNAPNMSCRALTSWHNRYVVTGGNDRVVKVWDAPQLGKPLGVKEKSGVQAFVGHSDHVTNVRFSADGRTLLTVGGGDTIFVWEFRGDASVDEDALVDASLEQAEEEQRRQVSRNGDEDHGISTPAEVLGATSAAAVATARIHGDDVEPLPEEALDVLRARMRQLDAEASEQSKAYSDAVAARGWSTGTKSGQQDDEDDRASEEDDAALEEDSSGEEAYDEDEDVAFDREHDKLYLPKDKDADDVGSHHDPEGVVRADPLGALTANFQLDRLIGFSVHAHDIRYISR